MAELTVKIPARLPAISLTDAERADILRAADYVSLTPHGEAQFGAIYRAGLAAGRKQMRDEAAKRCTEVSIELRCDEQSVNGGAYKCAAAVQALPD